MKETTAALTNPIIVNGHTILSIDGDTLYKFVIETKRDGKVSFATLKDARRWARRNKS